MDRENDYLVARENNDPLLKDNLARAIETSRRNIAAGRDIAHAWYDIGFCSLLLDRTFESLEAYGKAIMATASPARIEDIYASLTAIHKKVYRDLPSLGMGLKQVRSFLRLILVGRCKKPVKEYLHTCDAQIDGFVISPSVRDGKANPFSSEYPVVIVAGSCSKSAQRITNRYAPLIHAAFAGFAGIVCSGGTEHGVSAIVGKLANTDGRISKIGYLPEEGLCMDTYQCFRTVSGTFSVLDPMMLWADILAGGRQPESIRLLGIRGGEISAFEFQLGLLLGAKVGILPDSGGACLQMATDQDWQSLQQASGGTSPFSLSILSSDLETLRAFLHSV